MGDETWMKGKRMAYKFKVGDKVRCINAGFLQHGSDPDGLLKLDEEYVVEDNFLGNHIRTRNGPWLQERFELVDLPPIFTKRDLGIIEEALFFWISQLDTQDYVNGGIDDDLACSIGIISTTEKHARLIKDTDLYMGRIQDRRNNNKDLLKKINQLKGESNE